MEADNLYYIVIQVIVKLVMATKPLSILVK
jgi:hypothetical protein